MKRLDIEGETLYQFDEDETNLLQKILRTMTDEETKNTITEKPGISINNKDIETISDLLGQKGFDLTSKILMFHFILFNPKNQFRNEEDLVDYLNEKCGMTIHHIYEVLSSYNKVKNKLTKGLYVGEIPLNYLEKRSRGVREYKDGKKVFSWSGVQ